MTRVTRLPGLGELCTQEAAAGILRQHFLEVVSRLQPAALEALRDEVLPVYQRADTTEDANHRPACHREDPAEEDAVCEYTTWEPAPTSGLSFYPGDDVIPDEDLFEWGYELLGDPEATAARRSYTWRPKDGRPLAQGLPVDSIDDFDELDMYLARVRTALRSWGERFHLTDEWILSTANRQLNAWHRHWYLAHPHCKWPRATDDGTRESDHGSRPARPRAGAKRAKGSLPEATIIGPARLEWLVLPAVSWYLPTSAEERRLTFDCEGWDFTTEARSAARERILAEFVRFLDAYLRGQEERTLRASDEWHRTPAFSAREQYMQWLVRYQCLGENFTQIAGSFSAKPHYQTVAIPVGKLARLMGLTLRRPTRGRRSGSAERGPRHRVG